MYASDAYEKRTFDNTPKVHLANGVLHPQKPGKPANYLLIGVDTRTTVDQGSNADTMMVLHVEPATQTGFLVSFPRDLVVDIPGHGRRLLNAAYGLGGAHPADLVIQTLEENFAPLTIQHYIEVDFNGFQHIVNAIGRVKLWFPTPVHDPYVGLDVEKRGCVAMDGAGALASLLRARRRAASRDVVVELPEATRRRGVGRDRHRHWAHPAPAVLPPHDRAGGDRQDREQPDEAVRFVERGAYELHARRHVEALRDADADPYVQRARPHARRHVDVAERGRDGSVGAARRREAARRTDGDPPPRQPATTAGLHPDAACPR